MAKRIGVMTAGGDAPGQNTCLKALVQDAVDRGFEVVGIRKGWEGLLRLDPDNPATHSENAMVLSKSRVRDIDRQPGSYLHSSRLVPNAVPAHAAPVFLRQAGANGHPVDFTNHIKRAIERLDLEALVILGNRANLTYAAGLAGQGVPVVGIPMSVENDINGSHYSLGFSSALASGFQHLHNLRAMAGSREEIAVVELFGRSYGLTTMLIAVLAGADRVLIPEVPFDPENLAQLLIEDKRAAPASYAILVMSESVSIAPEAAPQFRAELAAHSVEGAAPAGSPVAAAEPVVLSGERRIGQGAGGSGAIVTEMLEKLVGGRMVFQPLNYLLRVGPPDGQDLLGAVNFARMAADLLEAGRMGRLVAYQRGVNYVDLPLQAVTEPDGRMNMVEVYDREACRARPGLLWAVRF